MDHPLYQQAYQLIESKHLGRIADQLKQALKPAIRMDSSLVSGHPLPVGASKRRKSWRKSLLTRVSILFLERKE